MKTVGYRKINSPEEGASNWDRFKAWQANRQKHIKRFQQSSAVIATSFIDIRAAHSESVSELAAQAATTRLLDKKA